jgi:hypothetical protein
MKLYTSEDLIKAIAFGFGICHKEGRAPFNKEMIEFIASLEPTTLIELPTDEEISEEAVDLFLGDPKSINNILQYKAFQRGAKWMRDKIQGNTQ